MTRPPVNLLSLHVLAGLYVSLLGNRWLRVRLRSRIGRAGNHQPIRFVCKHPRTNISPVCPSDDWLLAGNWKLVRPINQDVTCHLVAAFLAFQSETLNAHRATSTVYRNWATPERQSTDLRVVQDIWHSVDVGLRAGCLCGELWAIAHNWLREGAVGRLRGPVGHGEVLPGDASVQNILGRPNQRAASSGTGRSTCAEGFLGHRGSRPIGLTSRAIYKVSPPLALFTPLEDVIGPW